MKIRNNASIGSGGKSVGFIVGLVFVAAGLFFFFSGSNSEPYENGVIVEAEIVSVDRQSDSDGNDTCYIDAEYFVDGKAYVASSSFGSSSFCKSRGSIVEVSYEPSNPAGGQIISGGLPPRIFSLIFVVIGIFAFWSTLKSKKNESQEELASPPIPNNSEQPSTAIPPLPPGFAPGWYRSPTGGQRWWDGTSWTEHTSE
jgi:hypothetical protein